MRAINVLLAILVSLVLALLVFEGGLRLIGFAPEKTINHFDPALGWSKEPGARIRKSTAEYDVELAINDFGLRDDPMSSPAKPPGTYRVVCLGDSFTLGYTVERADLFVDQLEGWWESEGREVEVVNAGTEGYSTDQEVVWLMQHGKDFAPDLVLLFPYDNDIYWASQEQYFGKPKPRFDAGGALETRALPDPGQRGCFAQTALGNFYERFFGPKPTDQIFTPEGGSHPILKEHAVLLNSPPGFVTEAVTRTEGALKALKATCAELGAKLVVAPIPSHSAIDPAYRAGFGEHTLGLPANAWSPDLPVDTYLALCGELGIPTIDCRADFRQRMQAGSTLYYQVDWHLNAEGNRAFASVLHAALDEPSLALFPAEHAKQREGSLATVEPTEPAPKWPFVFAILWVALTALYYGTYRDEPLWQPPLKVGAMLAAVFTIVLGGGWLLGLLPAKASQGLLILLVLGLGGFIVYKLGRRIGTILELFVAFTRRGHWYLMPLVVVLLTIGSLLVVAASSPLIAPFIYTLF